MKKYLLTLLLTTLFVAQPLQAHVFFGLFNSSQIEADKVLRQKVDDLLSDAVQEGNIEDSTEKYLKILEKIIKESGSKEIKNELFDEIKRQLIGILKDNNVDPHTKIIELKSSDKKVVKRLSPNEIAKNFDIGYEQVSENDGKVYKIVENKAGTKRWLLKK